MAVGLEEQLLIAAIRESSARIPELVQDCGTKAAYSHDENYEPSEESNWADKMRPGRMRMPSSCVVIAISR